MFGGKNPILRKNDNRIRTIPFSTRRATYTELCRVYDVLMNVEIFSSLESIKNQFEKQKEEQLNSTHGSRKESPRNKNINRAKSRETKERPIPMKEESSSESEDEELILTTEECVMSLDDLKPFDDDVPAEIKKRKTPKKKRIKKKDKLKEIEENFKKRLYSACSTGEVDLLEYIGNDIKENKTAEEGNEAFFKILNGAIDEHGNTPLHIASLNGHEEAINWLMNNEASPCNKNDKFQTPYTVTTEKKIRDIFRTYAKDNPDKYNYPKVGLDQTTQVGVQNTPCVQQRVNTKALLLY